MTIGEAYDLKNIAQYCLNNRDPAILKKRQWTFIHIPQTADGFFQTAISNVSRPTISIIADSSDDSMRYDDRMENAIRSFFSESKNEKYKLISGHFKFYQLKSINNSKELNLMTMLRDPLDRVISDYNAQTKYESNITKERDIKLFTEFALQPMYKNVLVQYCCDKSVYLPEECIRQIKSNFLFVGIAEDHSLSLKIFYALCGMRLTDIPPSFSGSSLRLERSHIPPDVQREIALANALDYDVYRYFHDELVNIKSDFFSIADREDFTMDLYKL